jgi:hypothetical protein
MYYLKQRQGSKPVRFLSTLFSASVTLTRPWLVLAPPNGEAVAAPAGPVATGDEGARGDEREREREREQESRVARRAIVALILRTAPF